jgi:uncharacterized protein YjcR
VAPKYLTKPHAAVIGMIGAGRQAEAQLESICAVRPIRRAVVYSRRAEPLKAFCQKMSERLKIEVVTAEKPEDVTKGADIIVTMTNTEKPVLPYLYTITKNQLKMYYRSLKKTVPLKEEIAADTIKDDIPDESVLKVLDEKDRIYITEIADGYSYEEVSKRYKISLNTLKSRVRRARLKMKKINEEI